MKNVVVMIGSLRNDSVNRHVYHAYKEMAAPYFSMSEISIKDWPHYCQDITPFPAAVLEAAEQMKAADGVMFFSPEYNYSIPGVLKNAIDWLSRCENKPFEKKRSAIIGASPGNIGTARMQYHLRQVAVFLDLYVMNKPEVMIGGAYGKVKDGVIQDQATIDFLKLHVGAYHDFMGG